MGKTYVLDRVAADLSRGLTHPAIQRLSSLVAAYPTDLDLRRRLAAVHRRVGNRIQAGRWDYLTIGADSTDTTAFERAFPSAATRLREVRWPYRASAAATSYARTRLAKLVAAAQAEQPAVGKMPPALLAETRAADPVTGGDPVVTAGRAVPGGAGPDSGRGRGRTRPGDGRAHARQSKWDGILPRVYAQLRAQSRSIAAVPLAVAALATATFAAVGMATVVEWIVQ